MPDLTVPFDYASILIGDEVIFRALSQQQRFAQNGQYGQEWTDADSTEKKATDLNASILKADFSVPSEYQNCVPEPPCPWDKQDDIIEASKIKSAIFKTDSVFSYELRVCQRVDGQNLYTIGSKVMEYNINQGALASNIRGEYVYFEVNDLSQYTGKAVFVIERFHKGALDRAFFYLFDLTRP